MDQVKVVAPPLLTAAGVALSITEGSGACIKMVVDCATVPPGPEHVSVKLVFTLRSAVRSAPEVALVPVHPPDAVQLVAFAVLQRRTDGWPLQTVVGVALNSTVGAAAANVNWP